MNIPPYDDPIDPLDPGIESTVQFLRLHGFETVDSGDGKTKLENGYNDPEKPDEQDAWAFPHVIMKVPRETAFAESHRLLDLLNNSGYGVEPGQIQVDYDPVDKVAFLILMRLCVHSSDSLPFEEKNFFVGPVWRNVEDLEDYSWVVMQKRDGSSPPFVAMWLGESEWKMGDTYIVGPLPFPSNEYVWRTKTLRESYEP